MIIFAARRRRRCGGARRDLLGSRWQRLRTASAAARTFADDAKLWAAVIEQAHISLD